MMGNLTPFVVNGPPVTNTNTVNFTGGPWTFIRTHVDSSAETLATWRLDEDTSSAITFENSSGTNAAFAPMMVAVQSGTLQAFRLVAQGATDTGTSPLHFVESRIGASTAATVRPLVGWYNTTSNLVLSLLPLNSGANGALSWGTQTAGAPAFTTRSAGTRAVLLSNIGASTTDYAIGYESSHVWLSCEAAQNARGFKFYGGTTLLSRLSGDGILSLGTNTTNYGRLGQKFETNSSAAYGGAALNTWDSGAGCSLFDLSRSKSSTVGTYTVVASGDELGRVTFRGADGSAFQDAAGIRGVVDGTPGANDMPGRLTFWTTPDGSATATERMRITNAGDIGVGKTPTTGIILDVNGQLGIKSYTVATLPSASVQAGAIVYASDAGGNGPCLVISNGTNWKRCDNTSTTVT